jgi:hypothetical protein
LPDEPFVIAASPHHLNGHNADLPARLGVGAVAFRVQPGGLVQNDGSIQAVATERRAQLVGRQAPLIPPRHQGLLAAARDDPQPALVQA